MSIRRILIQPVLNFIRNLCDLSVLLSPRKQIRKASDNEKRILIIRLDAIGDFVLFSPSLKYYKQLYPDHKVTLLVNSINMELAKRFCSSLDELIPFESKKFGRNPLYRRRLIRNIRNRGFDVVIDPAYSRSRSAVSLVRFSGARTRIGFDADTCNITKKEKIKTDRYYTNLIPSKPGVISEIERNKGFIEGLGAETDGFTPVITPTEQDLTRAEHILSKNGLKGSSRYAVICLGAARKYRMWPLEKYIEVIHFLKEKKDVEVVLCGSKGEKNIARRVKDIDRLSVVDITGKTTLPELAAVLQKSSLYLGNETGTVHLAAAVGTPTVCVLGGGHFGRFFPYGDNTKNYAVYKSMDCFGCNWRCKYSTRKGTEVPCIASISVDSVLRKVGRLL